jgi:ribosomal protein S27AE
LTRWQIFALKYFKVRRLEQRVVDNIIRGQQAQALAIKHKHCPFCASILETDFSNSKFFRVMCNRCNYNLPFSPHLYEPYFILAKIYEYHRNLEVNFF